MSARTWAKPKSNRGGTANTARAVADTEYAQKSLQKTDENDNNNNDRLWQLKYEDKELSRQTGKNRLVEEETMEKRNMQKNTTLTKKLKSNSRRCRRTKRKRERAKFGSHGKPKLNITIITMIIRTTSTTVVC